ncbi:hypothetical protein AGMMS49992_33680 [Clostridia bacterium]|nr:hypothetical protein AGMMS49992_33680 [Clostridia bacterium]
MPPATILVAAHANKADIYDIIIEAIQNKSSLFFSYKVKVTIRKENSNIIATE